MMIKLSALALILTLSGCASSLDVFENRKSQAKEVYYYGSSIAGDGKILYLLDDERWELWSLTCTDATKRDSGLYKRENDFIILYGMASIPQKMYFDSIGEYQVLGSKAQIDKVKKEGSGSGLQRLFKKAK